MPIATDVAPDHAIFKIVATTHPSKSPLMKLAKKTFLIIAATLGMLIVIQVVLTRFILLNGFEALEKRDVYNCVDRARDIVQEQIDALADKVVDWSVWDDAYDYVQTRNEAFAKSNLTNNALPILKANMQVFLDLKGEVIYGKMADSEGNISDLSLAVLDHLQKHPALYTFRSETQQINGMISIAGLPMLISAHPIVKSDGSGPIAGTLIIGRYLDQATIDRLSNLSRLSLQIALASDQMVEPFIEAAATLQRVTDKLIKFTSNDFLTGYTIFDDVYGDKCFYMAVQVSRDVHKQANATLLSFLITMLIGGILLTVLTNLIMNRLVVHPIVKLNQTINQITRSDKINIRVPVTGKDEIAGLACSMNLMLDHIEEKKQQLSMTLEEYETAKVEAERANLAKSLFLANMSHEIRTPLNAIVGLAEIISFSPLDDEQKEMFKGIQAEANALSDLIGGVLDVSKIEAGHVTLEAIPFNLGYLFSDIIEIFSLQAEKKGITFQSSLAADVPISLVGDPGRLRQILKNLISNALKFTPKGGHITLSGLLVHEYLGDDKCQLKFSVQDTGIGIPRDKQGHIFESFQQMDVSTTRKYGGTGLGLTISKQLVELMEGQIGLDSVEWQGSTFWFTAFFKHHSKADLNPTAIFEDINGVKILVIHNGQEQRDRLAAQIESLGGVVVKKDSTIEALITLANLPVESMPQLIFCQLHMRDISGFDFVRELKAKSKLAAIPVILTTSSGNRGDAARCRELGVIGYWTEPLSRSDTLDIMITVLSQAKNQTDSVQERPLITRYSFLEKNIGRSAILLAEDYPTNQKVATTYLKLAGFEVDLANNGQEAVEKFRSKEYGLILMDVQMPVMDGIQATQTIRSIEQAAELSGQLKFRVPIVALTAHATNTYRDECLAAGMDDFITKPFQQSQLLAKVSQWLDGSQDPAPVISEPNQPAPQSVGPLPIDFDKVVHEFKGRQDLVIEVVSEFLDGIDDEIMQMETSIANGDSEALRRQAHAIKGGSSNIHACGVASTVKRVEALAAEANLIEAGAALLEMKQDVAVLKEYFALRINTG